MINEIIDIERLLTQLITDIEILNKTQNKKLMLANQRINKYKDDLDDRLVDVELFRPAEERIELKEVGILNLLDDLIERLEVYIKYFTLINSTDLERAVEHLKDYKYLLINDIADREDKLYEKDLD